jgi:hypothetical protein
VPSLLEAVEGSARADLLRPDDLVLVAILPARRDLEIARLLGWYRIPVQTAPKTVQVDWLALYLTGAFGEQRWSVRYLARVRGHELLARRELLSAEPDHPRAGEPYFKLQLGPLLPLDPPIPAAGWRRLTFLYTTGARMLQARRLQDLSLARGSERRRLWHMLRERARAAAWAICPARL